MSYLGTAEWERVVPVDTEDLAVQQKTELSGTHSLGPKEVSFFNGTSKAQGWYALARIDYTPTPDPVSSCGNGVL